MEDGAESAATRASDDDVPPSRAAQAPLRSDEKDVEGHVCYVRGWCNHPDHGETSPVA